MDPELDAMQAVLKALEPLDPDGRQRVVTWAAGRFELMLSAKKSGGKAAEADEEDEEDEAPPAGGKKPTAASFATLGELFAAADPKTNGQKALVVGYWLQAQEGMTELDGMRINTELKHLGYEAPNITTAMDQLKGSKPALAIQLRKSGTSKQARKKYKVTEAGMKAVETVLRGEEWR
jgi:hypothetical protein